MAAQRSVISPSASYAMPAAIIAGGVALAIYGYTKMLPGVVAIWVALIFASMMSQAPTFSGPNDGHKRPTAGSDAETNAMATYRVFSAMKLSMWFPSAAWLPIDVSGGFKKALSPVRFSGAWIVGAASGLAFYAIPVDIDFESLRPLLAVLGFLIVVGPATAFRNNRVAGYKAPMVTSADLGAYIKERGTPLGLGLIGIAVIIGAGVGGYLYTSLMMPILDRILLSVAAAVIVCVGILMKPVSTLALASWRELVETSLDWEQRWQIMKKFPAPQLIDHKKLGPATVDTFMAPKELGAAAFTDAKITTQIINTIGTGVIVDALPTPSKDAQGQDLYTVSHPLQFQVVTWPDAPSELDLGDENIDPDLFRLALSAIAVRQATVMGMIPAPLLNEINPMPSNEEHPGRACYITTWVMPGGQGQDPQPTISGMQGEMSNFLGTEVFADKHQGVTYVGDTVIAPPDVAENISQARLEGQWTGVWKAALPMGRAAPLIQPSICSTATLTNGETVHAKMFAIGQGAVLSEYFKFEEALSSAAPDSSMLTIAGHQIDRNGTRHNLGLTIFHSGDATPTSFQSLTPPRTSKNVRRGPDTSAHKWVITSIINRAFASARLDRPEVIAVKPFTPFSRGSNHIWSVTIRLYGSSTVATVRAASAKLMAAMSAPWLRIDSESSETVTIYAGVSPRDTTLANEKLDGHVIRALDWAQSWADAKTVSLTTGKTPRLIEYSRMPKNDLVEVLDFELPSDISVGSARAAKGTLMSSTGNEFIEIRAGVHGASSVRVLAAQKSPMSTNIAFDFEWRGKPSELAFATLVDGDYATIDLEDIPHVLMLGTTGSGKSVAAQGLIYGAKMLGSELVLIDTQKHGADFKFIQDRCRAFVTEIVEAAATMKAVYQEVKDRAILNSKYGVGATKDLPEEVRPAPLCVFVDEFLGLISAGKKPPTQVEDDPDREAQRVAKMNEWEAKKDIGYVFGRIAAEARSADVHLFLMTQKLTATSLDDDLKDLKTNMGRILLGKTNQGERMSGLRDPMAAPDPGEVVPKGRGVWESTMKSAELIQFWYANTDEYRQHLEASTAPVTADQMIDYEPYMPVVEVGFAVTELYEDDLVTPIKEDPVIDHGTIAVDFGDLFADMPDLDVVLDGGTDADVDSDAEEEEPTVDEPAGPQLVVDLDQPPALSATDDTTDLELLQWTPTITTPEEPANMEPVPAPPTTLVITNTTDLPHNQSAHTLVVEGDELDSEYGLHILAELHRHLVASNQWEAVVWADDRASAIDAMTDMEYHYLAADIVAGHGIANFSHYSPMGALPEPIDHEVVMGLPDLVEPEAVQEDSDFEEFDVSQWHDVSEETSTEVNLPVWDDTEPISPSKPQVAAPEPAASSASISVDDILSASNFSDEWA